MKPPMGPKTPSECRFRWSMHARCDFLPGRRCFLPGRQYSRALYPPVNPTRLVKSQCTCSSGFSTQQSHRVGCCSKSHDSLVVTASVRSGVHIFVQKATWTMSPALTRLEAINRTRPFKSLVPKSRQTGPAPSDLCSGVWGSRRLPRKEELGPSHTSVH